MIEDNQYTCNALNTYVILTNKLLWLMIFKHNNQAFKYFGVQCQMDTRPPIMWNNKYFRCQFFVKFSKS